MKSNEIRVDAQLLSGFQIDATTAFLWVKDAIKNILRNHPLSASLKTVEFTVNEEGEKKSITDELVRIENITKKGERYPIPQYDYECDELGNITFWKKGTYEVVYRYVPPMPNDAESELPIPDRYAEYVKYYVAARMRGRIYGQDDAEARSFDSLFWQYIADADTSLERTNKRHRRMPARF